MARALFSALVGLLLLFILAPIGVVVIASFSAGATMEVPPSTWSLRWYAHALALPLFVNSAWISLWLAAAASAIALPLALGAALVIVRGRFRGREALQSFLLAPLFVPAIVTGLAILLAFATLEIDQVWLRLIGAHVLVTFPYMVRTIMASLTRVDVTLEEGALTLGANPWLTFWHVTLPLIRPGIVAGMVFAFLISFDNVSVSLFLTHVGYNTLPLAILNYVEFNYDPSIAAISVMLIVLSLGIAVTLDQAVGIRRVVGH